MLMGLLAGSGLAADQKMGTGKTRPEAVYHNYCSVCHGDRGSHDSAAGAEIKKGLHTEPFDLTGRGERI